MEMNVARIRTMVVSGLRRIPLLVKTVWRLPYARFYILISPLVIILMMIFMFPYEQMIYHEIYRYNTTHTGRIDIREMDIHLVGDSTLEQVVIKPFSGLQIAISEVVLDPEIFPFFSRKVVGGFALKKLSVISRDTDLRGDLNGNLELRFQSGFSRLEGGDIRIMGQRMVLNLKNVELPPSMGGMTLKDETLRFSSASFKGKIEGDRLVINELLLAGADLRGTLQGTVRLRSPRERSDLDLNLVIQADSGILEPYREILESKIDRGALRLTLKGMAGRPSVSFSK
jgi:hypothetical protein